MLETDLFLSHWDASIPVCIPARVVTDLRNYHIMGVRFLYDCFRKGQKGAILNHESDMNFQIEIAAFLNALNNFITPQSPVLIVHSEECANVWHYHLTNHGGYNVTLLSLHNYEEILEGKVHRVILSTLDNVKLLREIKETDFFAVVVEQLDQVATKTVVKQLKSQFNIGLTNRNFLQNPDQKLFWTMLNWSNPGVLKKFTEFCSEDDDHLENLRWPYGTWWQRLTWHFCDSFKPPAEQEKNQYKTLLQKWLRQHNAYYTDLPKCDTTRGKRKVASKDPPKEEPDVKRKYVLSAGFLEGTSKNTKNLPKSSIYEFNQVERSVCPLDGSQETIVDAADDSRNLNSSQETVAYDLPEEDVFDSAVKEEKQSSSKGDILSMLYDEPKDRSDDDDVLSSIIKSEPVATQKVTNQTFLDSPENSELQNSDVDSTSCKNEILSLLFGDGD